MENASKHLQNGEEEDDLFVLWFYNVISLGSLKKEKKEKKERKTKALKIIYLFLSD